MQTFIVVTMFFLAVISILMSMLTAYADERPGKPSVFGAIIFPPLGITIALLIATLQKGASLWPYLVLWFFTAGLAAWLVRSAHQSGLTRRNARRLLPPPKSDSTTRLRAVDRPRSPDDDLTPPAPERGAVTPSSRLDVATPHRVEIGTLR